MVGNTLKCIQGPATERHLIEQLMDDVKRGQPHQTVLTNYTKTGQAFKNEVQIEPVGEADGLAAPHFLARSRISPVRNLALGISNVLADALSMGAGEFLSSRAYNSYVGRFLACRP